MQQRLAATPRRALLCLLYQSDGIPATDKVSSRAAKEDGKEKVSIECHCDKHDAVTMYASVRPFYLRIRRSLTYT